MNLLLRNNLFVAIHFHLGSPLVPIVILGPIIVFKTGNAISSAVVSLQECVTPVQMTSISWITVLLSDMR